MPGMHPTVVVASDDLNLLEEMVRYLEEIPQWRVVGSARSWTELKASLSQNSPDAALISSAIAQEAALGGWPSTTRAVVVGVEEDGVALRAALRLQARGFLLWPGERVELRDLVESGLAQMRGGTHRGKITALWSPKGGGGASVLAAHLGAQIAGVGLRSILVDLDLDHGDQTAILGAPEDAKNVTDLLAVADEVTSKVVDGVAWSHQTGLRVVLAPAALGESALVKSIDVVRSISSLKDFADHVIVDLPSGFHESLLSIVDEVSHLLLVVTPSYLSLRRAKDALKTLRAGGETSRIEVILNQSDGRDITAKDVEAVLGIGVVHEIPADMGLWKSPDRGEISPSGLKLISPLARRIAGLPEPSQGRLKVLRR